MERREHSELFRFDQTPSQWINGQPSLMSIDDWLTRQPGSYQMFFSKDDMINRIRNGELIPWIYMEGQEEIGLILMRIPKTNGVSILEIEFLSCENIFKMSHALEFLERYAANSGFEAIMATAHNTIAKAAIKRCGYSSPHQVIYKKLGGYNA